MTGSFELSSFNVSPPSGKGEGREKEHGETTGIPWGGAQGKKTGAKKGLNWGRCKLAFNKRRGKEIKRPRKD